MAIKIKRYCKVNDIPFTVSLLEQKLKVEYRIAENLMPTIYYEEDELTR